LFYIYDLAPGHSATTLPPIEAAFSCAGTEPAPEIFAGFGVSGFFSAGQWVRGLGVMFFKTWNNYDIGVYE
jgi:hypothetical protein